MFHIHGPQIAIALLDKGAVLTAPSVGFVVAQSATPTGLPGWLNGTIAGGVILMLMYLLKYTISLWQDKDKALNAAKDRQIEELQKEVKSLRDKLWGDKP